MEEKYRKPFWVPMEEKRKGNTSKSLLTNQLPKSNLLLKAQLWGWL